MLEVVFGDLESYKYIHIFTALLKIFAIFVSDCQIGSLVLVAFRLLFRKVKRPKFI